MTLEFGLYLGLIGTLFVFSVLAVVAVAGEVLKKVFRERVSETSRVMGEQMPAEQKKANYEILEIAAVVAAIYMYVTSQDMQRIPKYCKSVVEPQVWIIAGRMEQLASGGLD